MIKESWKPNRKETRKEARKENWQADNLVNEDTNKPISKPAEILTRKTAKKPAEELPEEPVKKLPEKPVEKPVEEPVMTPPGEQEGSSMHDRDNRPGNVPPEDQASGRESESSIKRMIQLSKLGSYEIAVNCIQHKNPAEMLEKFYLIRNSRDLSNEEKEEQVKKVMNEYME